MLKEEYNNPDFIENLFRTRGFLQCPNDNVVDFIIENFNNYKHLYTIQYAFLNPNSKMVKYLLEEKKLLYNLSYFNQNTNDIAVQYLIDNPKMRTVEFMLNKSDLAVNYIISNEIKWSYFTKNTNDIAVEYLLKNLHKYDTKLLYYNQHPKIIQYCSYGKIEDYNYQNYDVLFI